jgi:hypothetical protein
MSSTAADGHEVRLLAAVFKGCDRSSHALKCRVFSLSLDEIELVLRGGGYDSDPFVALSGAGLLRQALCDDNGQVRRVGGERAGAWISDQLNMAAADDVVDRVRTLIAQPPAVR